MAGEKGIDLEDLLVRPGTYFNPQTEIVVIVDDSVAIDQEVFEGSEAEWVSISDEIPVEHDALDSAMEEFGTKHHAGSRTKLAPGALEEDSDDVAEEEDDLEPDPDPDEEGL